MKYTSVLTCDLKHLIYKLKEFYHYDSNSGMTGIFRAGIRSLWKRSVSIKDDRFAQGKMPEVMRRCQLGEPATGKRAK